MKTPPVYTPDPKLDLVLERVIDVPRDLAWAAWTEPKHLKQWFTPRPWTIPHCEVDLRPGGKFLTLMRSPEGEEHPNQMCYLEIVPKERLVWTDSLLPGYRPVAEPPFGFTAVITFESVGKGTRYTAVAMHRDPTSCKRHDEMGFHDGWGTVLNQMVELCKTM